MSSKGKQISVIIAGATGSTGRNLVSRLVSHPDVSRVVALARHPIPVNRWTSVFPNLHSGDALRYLSVVPVDWVKVLADTSNVPSSYVSDGVWRQEDEASERIRFLYQMMYPQFIKGGRPGSSGSSKEAYGKTAQAMNMMHPSSSSAVSSSSAWSSVSTVDAPVGVRPVGYVKYTPRGGLTSCNDRGAGSGGESAAALGNGHRHGESSSSGSGVSDMEKVQDSQAFLQQLLHNNFYTSVFAGHHVAINCLGTSHMLSSSSVVMVDYELSIAFAKIMRLFNCMAHAEPTEDEERLLVETTSRELDSVLWGEIYAACYGKKPSTASSAPVSGQEEDATSQLRGKNNKDGGKTDSDGARSGSPSDSHGEHGTSASDLQRMSRGAAATLRHFTQVSVRGASDHSPVSYLRAHGRRDRDLLYVFNRHTHTFASPGMLYSLFFSKPITHTVSNTEVGRGLATQNVTGAGAVSIGPSPVHAMEEQASRHHTPHGAAPASTHHGSHHFAGSLAQGFRHRLRRLLKGQQVDWQEETYRHHRHARRREAEPDGDLDSVARHRAQLLLRRDVVKIWENASMTIWRPGVLLRPKPRMSEWLFSFVERPVDVRCLSECIVDDIMESLYKEGGFSDFGSVKVINGKSVSRRTRMKAIEDGLDERDTTVRKRFSPPRWHLH